jgi:hypothetical protein
MNNYIRIDSNDIKEGMRFSAPVFFDDGKNMFLAEGKSVKSYHVAALKRWSIPYLLTYGHEIDSTGKLSRRAVVPVTGEDEEPQELEELEEAEPVDERY